MHTPLAKAALFGIDFHRMRPGSLSTKLKIHLGETKLVGKIVREFGQWHEVPEETLFVMKLSIDELVTNIVTHSPKQPPAPEEIVIRLSTAKNELRAEVEDDGSEFNPLELPAPDVALPLEARSPGGLGIHLVRSLMDHVDYERVGQRNRLRMSKKVA